MKYIYKMELHSIVKNEILSFVTTHDHYVKLNRPDTEQKVPHDLIDMWNTKILQELIVEWCLLKAEKTR